MRTVLAIVLVVVSAACSGTHSTSSSTPVTARTPSPVPTRDPSKDGLPLVADVSARGSPHSFVGGDDHVTLGVTNRGRDILELVIDPGGWLRDHTIAMGTNPACNIETNPDLITCGPVYSGESRTFSIKAFANDAGTFHYNMRFYSRDRGELVPLVDSSGVQETLRLDEVVDPYSQQVPGYNPPASPTP